MLKVVALGRWKNGRGNAETWTWGRLGRHSIAIGRIGHSIEIRTRGAHVAVRRVRGVAAGARARGRGPPAGTNRDISLAR